MLALDRAQGDLVGRFQCRLRRGRKRGADLGDVELAEQIRAGDPEQLEAPGGPGDPDRGLPVLPEVLAAAHAGKQADLELGARSRAQLISAGDEPDGLRGAGEEIGDVRARRQQPGEPLGGTAGHRRATPALVAQQAQVPGGAAERVGHRAGTRAARVGIGRVRERLEHGRQQHALHRGGAADAPGERLQMAESRCRIGESERLEPGHGAAFGQPHRLIRSRQRRHRELVRGQPGDGGKQRSVEEFLVQPADLAGVALAFLFERRAVAETETAGEPAQREGLGRDHVGASKPLQLQAMFDTAQEAVRGSQA